MNVLLKHVYSRHPMMWTTLSWEESLRRWHLAMLLQKLGYPQWTGRGA